MGKLEVENKRLKQQNQEILGQMAEMHAMFARDVQGARVPAQSSRSFCPSGGGACQLGKVLLQTNSGIARTDSFPQVVTGLCSSAEDKFKKEYHFSRRVLVTQPQKPLCLLFVGL